MSTLRLRMIRAALAALAAVAADSTPSPATVLPSGFVETLVADALISPTATAHSGDGRIFVAEQSGRIRIVKNGTLLPTPFAQLSVDNQYERGLLGIVLDPQFATNGYVYVYYSALDILAYRLSRLTADGDVAEHHSEVVLAELPPYTFRRVHFGGALHFGPDGKLYVAVGEHGNAANSQLLTNPFGKILRLDSDGSIPADNPFFATATGLNRAIWAYGLRNPFTYGFDPGSGRIFINDVGSNQWEEINEGFAGANYGWAETEGPTSDPRFVSPIYSFQRGAPGSSGCAITGGVFYPVLPAAFPAEYHGKYFFSDFCARWIRTLHPSTFAATGFASSASGSPVDLDVGSDGSLYYLARSSGGERQDDAGAIYRVLYTGSRAPQITVQPESQTILAGDPVTFEVEAVAADSYQWQRDSEDIDGATGPAYTLPAVSLSDDGALFRVLVTNGFGTTESAQALLTATENVAPTATITLAAPREMFWAGDVVEYSGTAEDAEDGELGPEDFTWRVDFHHNVHHHPFVPPTSGVDGGEFTTSTTGETAPDVWYRVHLSVEDSGGRVFSTYTDIHPELADLHLETEPVGEDVALDEQPVATPYHTQSVVGLVRTISAEPTLVIGGEPWRFVRWSDSREITHEIVVPSGGQTYTATYVPESAMTCDGYAVTGGCRVNGVRDSDCQGTDERDVIYGTDGPDVIVAGDGDDRIKGLDGDDIICAGDGNDTIVSGAGMDTLFGEEGNDRVRAGRDDDALDGGGDTDRLDGGTDLDCCSAGESYRHCEEQLASCPVLFGD